MPHTASAEKRMRQGAKRRLYNKHVERTVKTAILHFRDAAKAGDPAKAQATLREAVSLLDKARSKGVLHRNTVSRRKSDLMRAANAVGKKT